MYALPLSTDADAPTRVLDRSLEQLKTPLWLVLDQTVCSANAAARQLMVSASVLPSVGRTTTVETAGKLFLLSAVPAPEYGEDVRLVEAQQAPRHRSDVAEGVKAVFNRAPEGAAIVGRDGCIHWTNQAYDDVTGRAGAEDVGGSLLLSFATTDEAAADVRNALVFGRPADVVAQGGAGAVSLRFLPLEDDLGRAPAHLVLIHDEAAAQAAAAMSVRLSNNEIHLKALEALVPGMLFQLERTARGRHRFSHVGARCEQILGVAATALEERVDRLFDVINGEDLRELKNALEESRAALAPLSWTGRTATMEGASRWIQITARAEALPDNAIRWHGMISDISHQKEMQRRVESHERLASVGELAAGVAHEINNPLAYVIANLRSVIDDLEAPPKGEVVDAETLNVAISSLREAEGGAERVHQIVRDLKQLSRPTAGNVAAVNVESIVRSSVSMAMTHIRQVANLEIDLSLDRHALGNEARLTQVVLNLLVNAAQAIPPGDAEHNAIVVRGRSDDENVTIEVCDSGVGIAPSVIEKIYEPFFTTKSDCGGTGLGLAMVHNIVREHGGRLEVESDVGTGSCFRIILAVAPMEMPKPVTHDQLRRTQSMRRIDMPSLRPAAATKAAPQADAVLPRVLLVDDEPALVRALARQLRAYDVTTASGGKEACERIANGERYDVILCDLMMPDCTGMQLYRAAVGVDPSLGSRFVFMTGGVFTDDARKFLADTDVPVLEKPFETHAVKDAVSTVIEQTTVIEDNSSGI